MTMSLLNEIPIIRDKTTEFTIWTPNGLMVPFEMTREIKKHLDTVYDEDADDPTLAARLLADATGLKVTIIVRESITATPL